MSSTEKDRERDREPLAARIETKLKERYRERELGKIVELDAEFARTELLARWIATDMMLTIRDDEQWARLERDGENGVVVQHGCFCYDTYGPKWARMCELFTRVERIILEQAGPGLFFEWNKTGHWMYQCYVTTRNVPRDK